MVSLCCLLTGQRLGWALFCGRRSATVKVSPSPAVMMVGQFVALNPAFGFKPSPTTFQLKVNVSLSTMGWRSLGTTLLVVLTCSFRSTISLWSASSTTKVSVTSTTNGSASSERSCCSGSLQQSTALESNTRLQMQLLDVLKDMTQWSVLK